MNERYFTLTKMIFVIILAVLGSHCIGLLGNDFIFDNKMIVGNDPRVLTHSWGSIKDCFTKDYWWADNRGNLYRPLTTLSYALNGMVAVHPIFFKITNLVLHALCSITLLLLLRSVLSYSVAFLAACLFATTPIASEVVPNIVGRADLFATLFTLLAIFAANKNTRWGDWLAAALAGLAVGFKESGILALPLVFFWLFAIKGQTIPEIVKRWILPSMLTLVLFVGYWFLRSKAIINEHVSPFLDNPWAWVSPWIRLAGAGEVFLRLLIDSLWPFNLSVDHSYPQLVQVTPWMSILGWICLLGMSSAPWWVKSRPLAWGLAFYPFSMLVTLNILFPTGSIMANRFSYLSMAGIVVVIALALKAQKFIRFLIPALGLPLIWLIVCSVQSALWSDEILLWSQTVKRAPQSFRSHMGYSIAMASKNGFTLEVYTEIKKAVTLIDNINPEQDYPRLHTFAGQTALGLGFKNEAIVHFQRSAKADLAIARHKGFQAGDPKIHQELGDTINDVSPTQAIESYSNALLADPLYPEAYAKISLFKFDPEERAAYEGAAALCSEKTSKRWQDFIQQKDWPISRQKSLDLGKKLILQYTQKAKRNDILDKIKQSRIDQSKS